MTLTLTAAEYEEIFAEETKTQNYNPILNRYEYIEERSQKLGQQGYRRVMNLLPGVRLDFINWKCDLDLIIAEPVEHHKIQLLILTSGCLPHDEAYPTFDRQQGYLSGSGISPAYQVKFLQGEHFTGVDLEIEPEAFSSLFDDSLLDSNFIKIFLQQDEWKRSFYPTVTTATRRVVAQMINAPYRGVTKKLYLQGKALELLAMQLDSVTSELEPTTDKLSLKPQSIDRIYQARDILLNSLENPPSILELTRQVGLCDRTLRRGFRELFGTTVVGYINHKRMEQAEVLLREKKLSVTKVADLLGYSHLGHFSAAFKRQFGINPSECLAGKKSL